MSTVVKTLETIATVKDLTVRLIAVVKSKSVFSFLTAAPAVYADVRTLVDDESLVLPELEGLDAESFGRVTSAAFGLVTAVVAAIKAP